ncbi:MAG: hypothetical protein HYY18_09630 [Planctomycetes bacterium]|nr:hypothetical protein [Planctomycetota bacterium]
MIVGGVAVGVLALVGLGFAMMGGDKTPPKKKEAAPAVKAKDPEKPGYDPWNDPSMMGSETDAAKRRKEGQKEQDKSGDVDRTKVDPGGGK